MAEAKFKVGDRVYAPFHGYGTVTKIHEDKCVYPIIVTWDDTNVPFMEDVSSFTADGCLSQYFDNDNTVLKVVDKKSMEADKKFMKECEKMPEAKEFKVGDTVWSFHFGVGIVIKVNDTLNSPYPITVRWTNNARSPNTCDCFTKEGHFDYSADETKDIVHVEAIDLSDGKEDTEVVDRMEDALSKKVDDAVNPSHYRVKGLPEAIDIINHLMHREQYEGFLWGNILKYAYRYGRKGDKAETAGKIAWYANQLKDLAEEGDRK